MLYIAAHCRIPGLIGIFMAVGLLWVVVGSANEDVGVSVAQDVEPVMIEETDQLASTSADRSVLSEVHLQERAFLMGEVATITQATSGSFMLVLPDGEEMAVPEEVRAELQVRSIETLQLTDALTVGETVMLLSKDARVTPVAVEIHESPEQGRVMLLYVAGENGRERLTGTEDAQVIRDGRPSTQWDISEVDTVVAILRDDLSVAGLIVGSGETQFDPSDALPVVPPEGASTYHMVLFGTMLVSGLLLLGLLVARRR